MRVVNSLNPVNRITFFFFLETVGCGSQGSFSSMFFPYWRKESFFLIIIKWVENFDTLARCLMDIIINLSLTSKWTFFIYYSDFCGELDVCGDNDVDEISETF